MWVCVHVNAQESDSLVESGYYKMPHYRMLENTAIRQSRLESIDICQQHRRQPHHDGGSDCRVGVIRQPIITTVVVVAVVG